MLDSLPELPKAEMDLDEPVSETIVHSSTSRCETSEIFAWSSDMQCCRRWEKLLTKNYETVKRRIVRGFMGTISPLLTPLCYTLGKNWKREQDYHYFYFRNHVGWVFSRIRQRQLSRVRNEFLSSSKLTGVLSVSHKCGFISDGIYSKLDPKHLQASSGGS